MITLKQKKVWLSLLFILFHFPSLPSKRQCCTIFWCIYKQKFKKNNRNCSNWYQNQRQSTPVYARHVGCMLKLT